VVGATAIRNKILKAQYPRFTANNVAVNILNANTIVTNIAGQLFISKVSREINYKPANTVASFLDIIGDFGKTEEYLEAESTKLLDDKISKKIIENLISFQNLVTIFIIYACFTGFSLILFLGEMIVLWKRMFDEVSFQIVKFVTFPIRQFKKIPCCKVCVLFITFHWIDV
jgi:hypothetical protein